MSKNKDLGKWAVIDIETTGVDASRDSIIDIGFLLFEGTELVKSFSSLVHYEGQISQFIQRLTGISQGQVTGAPKLESLWEDLSELEGAQLIAHNAVFEQSFLCPVFDKICGEYDSELPVYRDSIPFLGLLYPGRSQMNLESFIIELGLSDKEVHRGFEDSRDLLKVMLGSAAITKSGRDGKDLDWILEDIFKRYDLGEFWFDRFYTLPMEKLEEIAMTIDFNLSEFIEKWFEATRPAQAELNQQSFETLEIDFSGASIKSLLEDEGLVTTRLPNYHHRSSQVEMALKVGQSFKNNLHCLIQAPTGTGKTMGYLLPSVLFSRESKNKVLVATGTKALQGQALEKDVPQIKTLLGLDGEDFKIAKLVGSSNHLCELAFRNRLDEENGQLALSQGDEFEEQFIKAYLEVVFHYNTTAVGKSKPVMAVDLPYVFKRKFKQFEQWEKSSVVDFRACIGIRCPFKNTCSYLDGLKKAKEADLIVANHSMMFSWPKGFPRPGYVVVDEAHRLEHEATEAFGFKVSSDDLDYLVKQIDGFQGVGSLLYLLGKHDSESYQKVSEQFRVEVDSCKGMLRDHLKPLAIEIENHFHQTPRFTSQYWNEIPMFEKDKLNRSDQTSIYNHILSLKTILEGFLKFLTPYASKFEAGSFLEEEDLVAWSRFNSFYDQILDVFTGVAEMLETNRDYSRSLKFHVDRGYILESLPIDVGAKINQGLLEPSQSVIFTSATMAGGDQTIGKLGVEWLSGYALVEPERRFRSGIYLPPVFDYKANSKVFLCSDTPSLYSPDFIPKTLGKIKPLVGALGGKSLLLFSARTRFERAVEWLLENFSAEIPIFIQGMGAKVVEDYKKSRNGILVGMESFGEGIDIPGDGLMFVFIDKIPDLRQDLIIENRRQFFEQNFGNEFENYYLAGRCRGLHQKLGRLIRTRNDRGGVVIVDSRTKKWKSSTLGKFGQMMKPYHIEKADLGSAIVQIEEFVLGQESLPS